MYDSILGLWVGCEKMGGLKKAENKTGKSKQNMPLSQCLLMWTNS